MIRKPWQPSSGHHMQYEINEADVLTQIDDKWDSFSRENQACHLSRATVLGTSLWSHVVGEDARQLYQQMFRQVRRLQASASIPFRCDSPRKRRFLRLQIDPLPESRIRMTSLTERIEDRSSVDLLNPTIPRSDAVVTLYGWCKKVRLPDNRWAEAEDAINRLRLFDAKLPQLSHGICPACSEAFLRGLKNPAAAD